MSKAAKQRLIKAADIARDPLRPLLAEHLRTSKSGMEETAEGKVFLTVYVPAPQLVITGAVHISQALAPIGKLVGYDVTIVDPRTAFASPERFPDVKVIAEWPDKALPPLNVDRYTAFVALTHDPKIDDPALLHALARDCFYIGALGSRKTHARRVERLKAQGVSDAAIARIAAPVGLDIGAVSPAEIAVSIMAQITERLREEVDPRSRLRCYSRVMKFGAVAPKDALGATAVHTIRQDGLVLKKGTLIGPPEVAALQAAGIKDVVVARLEPGDVSEDVAAADIAKAVAGEGVHVDRAFTGRSNLFAQTSGVLVVDKGSIDRLNRVDEAITFATLPAYKPVVAGEMIATVKIIPFAVAGAARDAALAGIKKPLLRVAPYRIRKVGVVSTVLPGLATKVIEKTLKITAERLAPAGAAIIAERRVPHDSAALARALDEVLKAGSELVIVFGASAIADRRDVIPAALEGIGGSHRAFRHAGRPRQFAYDRHCRFPSGDRRARLRPKSQGKRFRLGAHAVIGRSAGAARGYHRAWRRRPADGNRHPAAAARRAGAERTADRRDRARRRPIEPHGRPEQAPRRDRRQAAGAHRRRGGTGLARAAGHRGHRTSARAGRGGACRPAGQFRAQSAFRRRAGHVAQNRHRRAAGRMSTAPSSALATCRRSMPA